ncbi:Haloalkane dehalogenase-like protein [Olavius algarvensis Delta 1 endosymbiont]|nr:Haloalkane dehalogenase-like protein [Olavius algarvensis Delta 1 endosymbiont]
MLKTKPVDISDLRHLYSFESRYLDIDGFKYHYLDEGEGDPLVMVHGNPTWSFYFRELITSLSPGYRTIVPDHMGCGLSDKPHLSEYGFELEQRVDDLENLLAHLGVGENITLVLHDWGGMIGMAFAVRHPERIRRLVLLNTYAFLPPADYRVPLAGHFIRRAGPLAALAVRGFNLFSVGALYLASRKGLARDVKKGLKAPYNCWHHRLAVLRFVQDIPLSQADSSYAVAKSVDDNLARFADTPILICWGEHDFVFNQCFLDEWQRRFPEAEVHRFSDAGHYVLEDVPEKIVPLVQDFLQRNAL